MQELMNENLSRLEEHDFSFVAGSPMVYHCHHYNLFFDQTVNDAVGEDRGIEVRTQGAYEAASQFLNALIGAIPPTSPEERLDLAATVFSAMGHGKLNLQVSPDGGTATGQNLHYGFAWREKYGAHIKRQHPADAFAAGYIAAATEAAFGLPFGSVECAETHCLATGADQCTFQVTPSGQTKTAFGVTQEDIMGTLPKFKGLHEDHIEKVVRGLRDFLSSVSGDGEIGLVSG